jgi:flagellar hook-length control protein FliK
MNATPPVFQPQRSNDALQLNASSSAGSQAAHANSQDFAGALNDAGDQPARKNTTSRPHQADSSGGQLPPSGNQPPLAVTPPPPAKTDAASANPGSGTGSVAAPGTTANAGAKGPPLAADSTPSAGTAAPAGTAPPAGAAPSPATIAAAQDGLTQDGAGSQPAGGAGMPPGFLMTAPDATAEPTASPVSTVLSGAAGTSAPTARVPAASSAHVANATDGAAPIDVTAGKANIAAATSAPTSNDGSAAALGSTAPNGDPSATDSGAAAQALMAAAIAQATSAPTTQSSPPADDLATPDTGAAAPGILGSGAAPAPAVAAAAASSQSSASMTAAVRTATALSIAQAVSASAGAGAADKHARGGSPDSSLTGMSNDGTAGAAQLMASSSTPTDATPPTTLKVSAGVDTAEFGQGVADRVSLMMDGNLTTARLQVNPPALGPIEVRIALQAGHAQVWFTSHSAVTRDALESSSPKLREMLGAQGFGQVSVDISQRSFQERSPQSHGYEGTPAISGESRASVQTASAAPRAASGLLDAYA